ncbi:hypothetical protein V1504DRAFT_108228 [Lipomyces starkeyi]
MDEAQKPLWEAASDGRSQICGAIDQHRRLLAINPSYRYNRQTVERMGHALRIVSAEDQGIEPILIPCVFHVVYHTDGENISLAQIDSQIAALNKDYNATNDDLDQVPTVFKERIGNPNVTFFRAKRGPDGSPTEGITRTKTSTTGFPRKPNGAVDESMKFTSKGGMDAWPSDRYLNFWICNFGDDLLGYAQFPGGPRETDGVVIQYNAFGTIGRAAFLGNPFNLGRTSTHEVGHWLDLYHIWGDDGTQCSGTDFVDDTPNQARATRGQPRFPKVSCRNGPNGNMFMNYMDYSDDSITIMFTKGQVKRMRAVLAGPRVSIAQSSYNEFFMHMETSLPAVDDNSKFLIGHLSNDVKPDLLVIRRGGSDGRNTEVNVLSGASSYKDSVFPAVTAFETVHTVDCDYGLADWTGSGILDLFVIEKNNTGTGNKEVHILSGRDRFQQKLLEKPISLPGNDDVWTFCISNRNGDVKPDLFCIKKSKTDPNETELHVLSGESNFQKTVRTTSIHLGPTEDKVEFLLTDYNGDGTPDLVVIWKSESDNKATRVQVLSGTYDYQKHLFQADIAVNRTNGIFEFLMSDWTRDGRPDLIAVKKKNTLSSKIEVHIMAG